MRSWSPSVNQAPYLSVRMLAGRSHFHEPLYRTIVPGYGCKGLMLPKRMLWSIIIGVNSPVDPSSEYLLSIDSLSTWDFLCLQQLSLGALFWTQLLRALSALAPMTILSRRSKICQLDNSLTICALASPIVLSSEMPSLSFWMMVVRTITTATTQLCKIMVGPSDHGVCPMSLTWILCSMLSNRSIKTCHPGMCHKWLTWVGCLRVRLHLTNPPCAAGAILGVCSTSTAMGFHQVQGPPPGYYMQPLLHCCHLAYVFFN